MIGNKILLDTNVIIFASKQMIDIDKFIKSYDEFYVSIITYLEVYGFEFSNENEKKLVDELFKNIEIVALNKEISEIVIQYRKIKTKKIKLPDAIILATANYLKIPLLTDDWDDFSKIDKNISVQNIDFLKIT
jgi:predicted nucleic acid-binding protein